MVCFGRQVLGNELDDAGGELVVGEEEVETTRSPPTPYMPSQSERDDHEVTHAQYRSWCEHCVQGRGIEMGHRTAGDEEMRGIPTVAFDYMFVTSGHVYSRAEWSESDEKDVDPELVLKVLVVRDLKSKSLFAHAVKCKGVGDDGYAVQCLLDDVRWLGYSKVILKSDNEPAIVRLLTDALKALRVDGIDQAMEEHPPPYDPQANGAIEIGVKLVKGALEDYAIGA